MTLIVGADLSAKKLALVAKETVTRMQRVECHVLYKGNNKQTPDTIHAAMGAMWTFLDGLKQVALNDRKAWVEQPLVGRGGTATTVKQAFVNGVVQACLVEAGFEVYLVHPSTWRSSLGIKAKKTDAVKAATRQFVQVTDPKLFSAVDGDSDLTDAAAIALHGVSQAHKARTLAARAARSRVQGR